MVENVSYFIKICEIFFSELCVGFLGKEEVVFYVEKVQLTVCGVKTLTSNVVLQTV